MTTYGELRLRIDRGASRGSYRVMASGPTGEAQGRFKIPYSKLELENFVLKVGTNRRGRRRVESPEMELAKRFGARLFDALFDGAVRELFRSSFAEARGAGQGLRLTLSLTGVPELLQVPWEYLYDHPSFLSISSWTPIVRYLDLPKPRRPVQVTLPIRILALVSAPVDAEPIDDAEERDRLESALAPLMRSGAVAIDWVEEASLRGLQRQLRKDDYHVFHFIGHGGYDQDADDGVLLLEGEGRRGRLISGAQLGTILADEVSLRLAVLNTCEGARSSLIDPFSGVATSLIEREIPAVVGMQFEITDRAAIVFASEFYAAIADGMSVDSSVAEARKAIYADENDIEWGTPVLFMRVADGRLFDVASHAPVRPAQAEAPTQRLVLETGDVATPAQKMDAEWQAEAEAERAERERLKSEADAAAAAEQAEADRLGGERLKSDAEAAAAAEQAEADRLEGERLDREAEAAAHDRAERERLEREGVAAAAAERAALEELEAAAEAQRAERELLRREREAIAAAEARAEQIRRREAKSASARPRVGAAEARREERVAAATEVGEVVDHPWISEEEIDVAIGRPGLGWHGTRSGALPLSARRIVAALGFGRRGHAGPRHGSASRAQAT
jgi:hypothetical protein